MSANDRSPWWWIDFEAIPDNVSRLSGGERRLLLIAASIGGTTTTEPLGELIGGLDRANVALVLDGPVPCCRHPRAQRPSPGAHR